MSIFSLANVVMRHDTPNLPHMAEQYPHLIFHNISSNLGKRVCIYINSFIKLMFFRSSASLNIFFPYQRRIPNGLSHLPMKRISSLFDNIYGRKVKEATLNWPNFGPVLNSDVGFCSIIINFISKIAAYCIINGTLDNADSSETEWALRSYINRKTRLLTNERE